MENKILIIDDERNICSSLTYALEDMYHVDSSTNSEDGLNKVKAGGIDLVLLDLRIGNVDGLEILSKIKELDKNIVVVMMTAYGSIQTSVDAMRKGAFTYLTKPLNIDELMATISQAMEYRHLNEKVEVLSRELKDRYIYNGIIGKSPSMKNVFKLIEKLKDVDTNVMITGESGTGKELVSRAIHFAGRRATENFVEINCAAIPEGLLEEELFGHKKGTFTGAVSDKIGKFQYANNGTIFLDEIGDMPHGLQAKLLRVLQQREFTPLGVNEPLKLNVRVIAATNKDLKTLIDEGIFRSDLYFRLNVIEINLPPLREKRQDLPLLFDHFIEQYNKEQNKRIIGLSREAEQCLLNYGYPGNIRELQNIIECGVLLARDNIIELDNLPAEVRGQSRENYVNDEPLCTENLVGLPLQEAEKRLIKACLELNKGHRKDTAAMLGISERGLRYKINEYELS